MVQQVSFDKQHHQKKQPRTDENSSPPLLGRHKQGVIMPAEATVGGSSRSKQQHQQQQPSSDAARDRTVEPLIVFDWDDTILTSSWIQVNELLQAGSYDELPLEVRRDLARLERSAIKCLKNARQLGTVIIITNAESGWVELSAARFFVNVLPLLEGVPVISARSLFEPQFPGSPLCWKSAAFAYMMHDHFLDRPQWLQKKVVSIGDSNEEKVAMRIASAQHGTMAAKAVKFITGPDPEALACQLDYVTKNLASVVASDSDVDIVLDASTIHGSYSLPLHSRGVYDDLQQQPQHQHQHQQPSSSSSAPSTPFYSRASSEAADPSPSCTTSRPASSPQPCSIAPSASLSTPDAAAGPAGAHSSPGPIRPSTACSSSSSSSSSSSPPSSSSSEGSGAKDEGPTTFDRRGRRSTGGGSGHATAASSSSSSSSSSTPPSPQHLALKRRASSSPIPIPTAGHGPGHGRVGGGGGGGGGSEGGNGLGNPRAEGESDCAQPFSSSATEVGGPLASLSGGGAADGNLVKVSSSASSASSTSSEGEAMALSPASLVDGGGCASGGGGGDGAEGGGRSAFGGGGPPCLVDNRCVGRIPAVDKMFGGAVGQKEIPAGGDGGQGRRVVTLFGGGCGGDGARRGAAVDGMVGVVEGAAAASPAAIDTAPKA